MDLGNLLQGVGIFVCIGAILLGVLAFVALRRAFAARPKNTIDRQADPSWQQRGHERPQYDSERVESSGGFGNAPGSARQGSARTYGSAPLHSDRPTDYDRRDLDEDREARQRRDRDDDVQSQGGFGGG